jgi:uncharacterized protein (TIGR02996 family)
MAADETAFLGALRDDPGDADTRRVYADWLEEHCDPRAEYLRLELELHEDGAAAKPREYAFKRRRLAALAAKLDPDWRAAVERPLPEAPPVAPAPPPAARPTPLSDLPPTGPDAWRDLDRRAPLLDRWLGPAVHRRPRPSALRIVLLGLVVALVVLEIREGARDPRACLFRMIERTYSDHAPKTVP